MHEPLYSCSPTPGGPTLRGSRCMCPTCGLVFSGESAFDRHREGPYEPHERRCLTSSEFEAKGLFIKPSGVVGRRARKVVPAGTAERPSTQSDRVESVSDPAPSTRPVSGDASQVA